MDDEKIVADVKCKRSDTEEPVPGTLCLTVEGIAFVPQKSNKKATFLLTLDMIKNHKHSEKGPLKFVLPDDEDAGPTFEFERLPLRDVTRNVFEIFKTLYRGVGDNFHPEQCMPDANEMYLRTNALNVDIHLKKLHDELVVAEILTEFEFWDMTKTWPDLSSLKIPNAQTRSNTEGLPQLAGDHAGMTDTENSAIDKPADKTLEPEASSSELETSKGTSEVGSTQEKSETKLSDPDEPSGLSGDDDAKDSQALHFRRLEKDILTRIAEVDMKMEAKIYNVEAKLEAKIGGVEEKLDSIGKMLAAFITKQGMAVPDSNNLEARKSEVTQIADAAESTFAAVMLDQTKAILDLYPEDHHQKILQSGLPSDVKEQLLFDNILANTLMVCFHTQKPHAGLFAFYKAGLLRNAMADVLEKLQSINEPPEVIPLVNPIKKRLGAAITKFNDFLREERKKTNRRVKN